MIVGRDAGLSDPTTLDHEPTGWAGAGPTRREEVLLLTASIEATDGTAELVGAQDEVAESRVTRPFPRRHAGCGLLQGQTQSVAQVFLQGLREVGVEQVPRHCTRSAGWSRSQTSCSAGSLVPQAGHPR